ncbi:MAG: MerR family transcriptional regulator [Deltaproteobacteria bacterium]|nr:MerR family transcriptional regulator [Deltaproteobacteria bacterium]
MRRDESFSIGEVCRLVPGLTRKMVRYWHQEGFLGPAIIQTMGQRYIYRFDKNHLKLIKKIKGYLDRGYQLRAAAEKAGREVIKKGNNARS